jgi:hypothetical protein
LSTDLLGFLPRIALHLDELDISCVVLVIKQGMAEFMQQTWDILGGLVIEYCARRWMPPKLICGGERNIGKIGAKLIDQ